MRKTFIFLTILAINSIASVYKGKIMKFIQIASNMTELTLENGIRVLFSYSTPVACESVGKRYRTDKKWSQTTSRHINAWLGGAEAEEVPQEFFENLLKGV